MKISDLRYRQTAEGGWGVRGGERVMIAAPKAINMWREHGREGLQGLEPQPQYLWFEARTSENLRALPQDLLNMLVWLD